MLKIKLICRNRKISDYWGQELGWAMIGPSDGEMCYTLKYCDYTDT